MSKIKPLSEEEIRLHALNLAVALHKDTYRFRFGKFPDTDDVQPEQDVTGEVLISADRFRAWLYGSTEAPKAAEA